MSLEQFKETLRDHCDITEIINSYLPLKRAGVNFKALCPFHQEKTPSFTVNPSKQIFYCFGCQRGGDVFRFVMEHEGVDFITSMKILAQRVGLAFPERETSMSTGSTTTAEKLATKDLIYDFFEKLSQWYQKNLRSQRGHDAMSYVRDRGLTDDMIIRFGIGLAPDSWHDTRNWGRDSGYSDQLMVDLGILTCKNQDDPPDKAYDRFRNRLMFPIYNEQGRVIAFSGRVLADDGRSAKYINNPESMVFTKGKTLYGLSLAREAIRKQGYVLLCEGQMDVIACHQAGIANAVAPLGTAFTESQARLVKRHTDSIVLLFDADDAGVNAVFKSADAFIPAGLTAKVVVLDDGDDPDSLLRRSGPDGLTERILKAEDVFIYRLNVEIKRHDMSTPTGKAKVIENVLEAISKVTNLISRAEYCRIISDRLGVRESIVFHELKRISQRDKRRNRSNRDSNPNTNSAVELTPEAGFQNKAERILLELALYHGIYAHKLVEELPIEMISKTAVGQALNEVLAHTEQGEWAEATGILTDKVSDYRSTEITNALFNPEYGPETDKNKLARAYMDCLYRGIFIPALDKQMVSLQQRIKSSPEKDEKNESQREYLALRKRKSDIYHRLESP